MSFYEGAGIRILIAFNVSVQGPVRLLAKPKNGDPVDPITAEPVTGSALDAILERFPTWAGRDVYEAGLVPTQHGIWFLRATSSDDPPAVSEWHLHVERSEFV